MKSVLVLVVLMMIGSCSGYFDNSESGSSQASTLATVDGRTLSLAGSDQITPFLYRDTNGQNPILFYASDQDEPGNFDIWYARMNDDGVFQEPVKISNLINSSSNEISPVVFWGNDSGFDSIYISLLRKSTNSTEVLTYQLTNVLGEMLITAVYTVQQLSASFTNLGLYRSSLLDPGFLTIYNGTSMMSNVSWGTSAGWMFPFSPVSSLNGLEVYAQSSMSSNIPSAFQADYSISEIVQDSHSQLYIYANIQKQVAFAWVPLTNLGLIDPSHASAYNDRQPFVDWFDPLNQGKIYFSSDREGDFDLYRYNTDTFTSVMPFYPLDQSQLSGF